MIKKALFVGAMGLITVMAALGLGSLRDSSTPTAATTVIPVQPFAPTWILSGTSSTVLSNTQTGGNLITNRTEGQIPRGTRIAIPYIYSSADWYQLLSLDAGTPGLPGIYPPPGTVQPPTGTVLGSVIATLDVNCNMDQANVGQSYLAWKNGSVVTAYPWVLGQIAPQLASPSDTWLYAMVPPFPWLLRDTSHANHFVVAGASAAGDVTLTTVFGAVPFSPNGGADVATTKNGGNPEKWTVAGNGICIDTPQDSTSYTATSYSPPKLGYTGGACTGTCSDAAVYGPMVTSDKTGAGSTTVKASYVNRGPNAGTFTSHWEIIATNPTVADATWATGGLKTLDVSTGSLAAGSNTDVTQNMNITCPHTGEGLIVVKNVLWPNGTQDYFPTDNANVNTIKVVCTTDSSPLSDVTVDLLRPMAVSTPNPPTPANASVPEQINLQNTGQSATLTIREINTNNETTPVTANQFLEAETSGVVTTSWGTITLAHNESGGSQSACTASGSCTELAGVSELAGMSDLTAPLTITCPNGVAAGRYSVVVTGILAPVNGEKNHGQKTNAQRLVVMVNCWSDANPLPDQATAAAAGLDDGNGLYVRWTIAISNPDDRASFASPPSFPADLSSDSKLQQPIGGYIEHVIQVGCYYMAIGGCFTDHFGGAACPITTGTGTNPNDYTPEQTRADYRYAGLGAVDTVQCMEASAVATAGHPVALAAPGTVSSCGTPQYVYTGSPAGPLQAGQTFTNAQDRDCDGLPDGVEVAWGSNLLKPDTDSDGSPDFVEMFEGTSPISADTDGDGYVDKPYNSYGTNASKTMDNCPTIYNADQLSTFGGHKVNYIPFAGSASVTTGDSPAPFLKDTSQNWTAGQWIGQTVIVNLPSGQFTLTVTGDSVGAGCSAGSHCMLTGDAWGGPTGNAPGNAKPYGIGTIATGQSANPNKMKLGDVCNPDIDNDGLPNTVEDYMAAHKLAGEIALNKMNPDTNGNHCVDGAELFTSNNPASTSSVCDPALTTVQEKFFRACHFALPPKDAYNGIWNGEGPQPPNDAHRTELDPSGSGTDCITGSDVTNSDNNGDGIADGVVVEGYNLAPASLDTDGDGCYDWAQINDVNGDGIVDSVDQLIVAQRGASILPPNTASDFFLDVNHDQLYDSVDSLQVALNVCSTKGYSGGCTGTGLADDMCYNGLH